MSLFDVIRYNVNEDITWDEVRLLPGEVYNNWRLIYKAGHYEMFHVYGGEIGIYVFEKDRFTVDRKATIADLKRLLVEL